MKLSEEDSYVLNYNLKCICDNVTEGSSGKGTNFTLWQKKKSKIQNLKYLGSWNTI